MVRVFENRALRLIMEPKRTEIYGGSSFVPPTKFCYNDHIRVEEMGRECGTHGRYEKNTGRHFMYV
jgi:hypothetical protein